MGPRLKAAAGAGRLDTGALDFPFWGACGAEKALYESGSMGLRMRPVVAGRYARMDSYPRSSEALKREVSAEGEASLFAIVRGLWPYIWPADRRDLKLRVAAAHFRLEDQTPSRAENPWPTRSQH